jgi:hypothetical protein
MQRHVNVVLPPWHRSRNFEMTWTSYWSTIYRNRNQNSFISPLVHITCLVILTLLDTFLLILYIQHTVCWIILNTQRSAAPPVGDVGSPATVNFYGYLLLHMHGLGWATPACMHWYLFLMKDLVVAHNQRTHVIAIKIWLRVWDACGHFHRIMK